MALINLYFVDKLNNLLSSFPASVTRLVTTPRRNATIGGAKQSKHLTGEAADLVYDNPDDLLDAAKYAKELGFGGIEVDYRNNHLHVDLRDTIWHVVCTKTKTYTLDEYLDKVSSQV